MVRIVRLNVYHDGWVIIVMNVQQHGLEKIVINVRMDIMGKIVEVHTFFKNSFTKVNLA